jgi:hypothetical protein
VPVSADLGDEPERAGLDISRWLSPAQRHPAGVLSFCDFASTAHAHSTRPYTRNASDSIGADTLVETISI